MAGKTGAARHVSGASRRLYAYTVCWRRYRGVSRRCGAVQRGQRGGGQGAGAARERGGRKVLVPSRSGAAGRVRRRRSGVSGRWSAVPQAGRQVGLPAPLESGVSGGNKIVGGSPARDRACRERS